MIGLRGVSCSSCLGCSRGLGGWISRRRLIRLRGLGCWRDSTGLRGLIGLRTLRGLRSFKKLELLERLDGLERLEKAKSGARVENFERL